MKKLTLFFTCLLLSNLLLSQSANAQEEESSKIKVYNADQSDKDQSDNSYRWAIKTDLSSPISQEFPIIAEYRITKKLSIEASAAITYAYFSNDDYFDQLKNEDLDKKPETDNAFRIGLKYYPSRRTNALDGWFVGIQAFTKNTKRSYDDLPGFNGREIFDTKNKEGISLQLGKQMFTSNNFLYEGLIGIGLANVTRDYYVRNERSIFTFDEINDKKTSIYFQLGFRIGFGN